MMKRIVIIGVPASGKSTLARELGQLLGLPVIDLDQLYWKPGWVPTDRETWIELQRELVQGDRWILDGNFQNTLPLRVEAADTIIYLDLPRRVALWRAIMRSIRYWRRQRPGMAKGCVERINWELLAWIWDYPGEGRPETLALVQQAAAQGKQIIHPQSRRDVRDFLNHTRQHATIEAGS